MPECTDEYFVAQGAIDVVRESSGQPDAQFEEGCEGPVDFLETNRFQVREGDWRSLKKGAGGQGEGREEFPIQKQGNLRAQYVIIYLGKLRVVSCAYT